MRIKLLSLLLVLLCSAPSFARPGHVSTLEEDVRGLWKGLQSLSEDFLPHHEDMDRTLWHVARGQMAWHTGDAPVAAIHLLKAIRDSAFQEHEAYPEALYFLSEALFDLQVHGMARELLERALQVGAQNRHFKHMLARYLEVAWQDHSPKLVDRYVGHYRNRWMTTTEADEVDARLRYFYGKALFHRKDAPLARAVFEGLEDKDPNYLRAQYFVANTWLMQDDIDRAASTFETVAAKAMAEARRLRRKRLAAARAKLKKDERKPEVQREDRDASSAFDPKVTVTTQKDPVDVSLTQAEGAERAAERIAALAALARARLASVQEDPAAAWRWYRRVAPGSEEYALALREAIWVQLRRGNQARAERLAQQFIQLAPEGREQGLARIVQAHLIASAGEFERAETQFEAAMLQFGDALKSIETAGEGLSVTIDGEVSFNPLVVAWTDPDDLVSAKSQLSALNGRTEELMATLSLVEALEAVVEDPSRMPVVKEAHLRGVQLRERVSRLRAEFDEIRRQTVVTAGGSLKGGRRVLPGKADISRRLSSVEQWIVALDKHLEHYLAAVEQEARRQAEEVRRVLEQERSRVLGFEAELKGLEKASIVAARGLADGARDRVQDLYLKAALGMTNVAYKRKELVSQEIVRLLKQRKGKRMLLAAARQQAAQTEGEDSPEVNYPPGLQSPLATPATEEADK